MKSRPIFKRRAILTWTISVIATLALLAYSSISWHFLYSHFWTTIDNLGPGQCFSPSQVNASAPCAPCVHFITVAVLADRWGDMSKLAQGVHVTAAAMRASQKCFTLLVYTNVPRESAAWRNLEEQGGQNVSVLEYPTDLPKNAYSGRKRWIELCRRRLDLLERYELQRGRKAIWIDLDTIVVADLSCVYARAPNFVVSRQKAMRFLWGPGGKLVKLHLKRSIFGDLFMLDSNLISLIRGLERSGMPAPPLDVQDYMSYLLNRCDGSVVDLRALVRTEGFARGDGMCFGFDFAQGYHPSSDFSKLKIIGGKLHCGVERHGKLKYFPVGSLSFTAMTYWQMLNKPKEYFHSRVLQKWARASGIIAPNR